MALWQHIEIRHSKVYRQITSRTNVETEGLFKPPLSPPKGHIVKSFQDILYENFPEDFTDY